MGIWIKEYRGKHRDPFTECTNDVFSCECSECGWHTGNQAVNFDFCPRCGAKMENVNCHDVVPLNELKDLYMKMGEIEVDDEASLHMKWACEDLLNELIKQYEGE